VPTVPGGGTVAYVNPFEQQYLTDPVAREEGGTPNIVGSIRAGLCFGLKDAVGTDLISAREEHFWQRALAAWRNHPNLDLLGDKEAARLSIVSFVVRHGPGYLHHNYVVALLNDVFGIQARGGCSCAGPYGHRLLGIDLDRSHAFQRQITQGCEGIKPGWTRVNFNYFISEAVCDYIVASVQLVADHGWKLLTDYTFDPTTGLWHHRAAPVDPPVRLTQLSYDETGELRYPTHHVHADESALAGYLDEARQLFAAHGDVPTWEAADPASLGEDFETLRWFPLPAACLK
jgi:hypothetical protein